MTQSVIDANAQDRYALPMLIDEARTLHTTGALFEWLHTRGLVDYRIVAMDEYTLDIVVPVEPGLTLVFDTT